MLHDISNQEAQTAWDMALENPDIFKSGEGKNKRVAVHGIPTIEGLRAKTFQREVAHESALGEHGLMESALGRLDFASQGVDMAHDFGGLMGDVFRPVLPSGTVRSWRSWQRMVMMRPPKSPPSRLQSCRFDMRRPRPPRPSTTAPRPRS